MVFPAAIEEGDGAEVAAPPMDAEESRATTQRPVLSTVPTLLQRLQEMIESLQLHHERLLQGCRCPNAWHSCQEAKLMLDLANECEGTEQLRDRLASALHDVQQLL